MPKYEVRATAQVAAKVATDKSPALPITKQLVFTPLKGSGFVLEEYEMQKSLRGSASFRVTGIAAGKT